MLAKYLGGGGKIGYLMKKEKEKEKEKKEKKKEEAKSTLLRQVTHEG